MKGKICMILWWKLILLMSVWGAEDMFATEGECCYNVSYTKTSGNRVANKKQKINGHRNDEERSRTIWTVDYFIMW